MLKKINTNKKVRAALYAKGARLLEACHSFYKKRLVSSVLLCLVFASTVITLPILNSSTSYAADVAGVYADDKLMTEIRAYAYRNALTRCLLKHSSDRACTFHSSQVGRAGRDHQPRQVTTATSRNASDETPSGRLAALYSGRRPN
jgi:hypothetical protein